jgi:hypothetical protein
MAYGMTSDARNREAQILVDPQTLHIMFINPPEHWKIKKILPLTGDESIYETGSVKTSDVDRRG